MVQQINLYWNGSCIASCVHYWSNGQPASGFSHPVGIYIYVYMYTRFLANCIASIFAVFNKVIV